MASSEADGAPPLAGQIRELSRTVQADLIKIHDYYEHTKTAWRFLQEFAVEGRLVDIDNSVTGTSIPLTKLASRSVDYANGELIESAFERLLSLLEHRVFGLLKLWLMAHPEGIPEKDKKTIKLADFLAAVDKQELLRAVVDGELLGFAYKRPAEWFKYLKARVNLALPTEDQVRGIAEIKATHDLLIHNQGIVNATYLDKAGSRARFAFGQRVEIPEPYFHRNWELIRDLVGDMASQATVKSSR